MWLVWKERNCISHFSCSAMWLACSIRYIGYSAYGSQACTKVTLRTMIGCSTCPGCTLALTLAVLCFLPAGILDVLCFLLAGILNVLCFLPSGILVVLFLLRDGWTAGGHHTGHPQRAGVPHPKAHRQAVEFTAVPWEDRQPPVPPHHCPTRGGVHGTHPHIRQAWVTHAGQKDSIIAG